MDAFEEVFMSSVWANFTALATKNKEKLIGGTEYISLWQAKCLLVRTLGVTVPQRHMIHLLQTQTAVPLPDKAAEAAPKAPLKPQVPQLTPLRPGGHPSAATGTAAPLARVLPAPAPAAAPEAPPGYLTRAQFAVLLAAVQQEEGLPFTTIASSIYRNLEATHRGYVDSASLTAAARTGKCGPSLLSKMPAFFAACDEIGIGKMSTTQVSSLLAAGAALLTKASAS